jgi:hypothetical protein
MIRKSDEFFTWYLFEDHQNDPQLELAKWYHRKLVKHFPVSTSSTMVRDEGTQVENVK